MHMCGRVHASTQFNTTTLKIYLGQGISAYYGPDDASLVILCSSDDQYSMIFNCLIFYVKIFRYFLNFFGYLKKIFLVRFTS